MTKEEILKRVKKFQGANREFSQELPPIIEGLVDLIDEAGPEVVDNLTSNSPTKALSANMGKELKLMVDGKVSEPETAGTAGQILQLDEEGVPEWVDAAEVGATYDSTVSDTSTNAIQNKTIKKYVDDNFAQKDGYYSSLTAGAAENLVGRGSVPAEIAFRTSGGDQDLGTGTAQMTKILGRTEAFNQLVGPSDTQVTIPSGHHYYAIINGTASVGTSDGTPISVTGGTDIVVDLTLEGLGLTTAEQFRALHPLGYYSPASKLINNAATGLETVGFNQWDEEWEAGRIDATTGQNQSYGTGIRSKNYIPALPSTTYYGKNAAVGALWILEYDANMQYLGIYTNATNNTVTTSSQTRYLRFYNTEETTYNHDICINLSWSGYHNGEYEPYEKHTLALPLNAIACHDENNNAVVVNGLDGVGTVQDEAVVENGWVTKIVKRVGSVDMGTLNWRLSGEIFLTQDITGSMMKYPPDINTKPNIICSKYVTTQYPAADKHIYTTWISSSAGLYIGIKDSAYSDAATFKAAMDGVYLDYELATPLTLTVDEPFAASYYVNDFGTEARLPQDTADAPQAPFCAEIQYAMNATDTLRRLPSQYISDESMTNILTALKTAGIIADFTLTYDSEHQYFTCSVTAPSQGE